MNEWLISQQLTRDPPARLYCFPYAGRGASVFMPWSRPLAPIEVRGVQLPGREGRIREAPLARMGPIATMVADAVQREVGAVPFAFFGHSMGGLVAFEVARELRRRGAPTPRMLFVSACRGPQIAWDMPAIRDEADPVLIERLRLLGGTSEELLAHRELLALLLPAFRGDLAVLETYQYAAEAALELPICAFGGLSDTVVEQSAIEQWRAETTGAFELTMVPGHHYYLQSAQAELLASISRRMRM